MSWSTDPFPSLEELAATVPAASGEIATVSPAERAAELEQARREGFERGLAEGREAGRREAIEAARPDVAFALTALTEAIEDLHRRDNVAAARIAEETIDLALTIAEAVIGRELQIGTGIGRDALVRAMTVAPDRGEAVARMHPLDVATLRGTDNVVAGRAIEIVADDTVERGGAIVTVGATTIDAQLGAALDRVRDELAKLDVTPDLDGSGRTGLTVFEGGRS